MKLIDKSALIAEIERRLKVLYKDRDFNYLQIKEQEALLSFLNTLEVKESDVEDELQGIEKEVAEGTVNRINEKRIPIELKGEKKAKFKNEFNTLWQTIGGIQFANVAKHIIERLCLHFAAWGVYNLKEYIKMKPEEEAKLDVVKVKEVDLEKEIDEVIHNYKLNNHRHTSICAADIEWIAEHFFKLGLKTQKGE